MAKLSSNGKCICEMKVYSKKTDRADGDAMTQETTTTYRAMSSGKILKNLVVVTDYGMGAPTRNNYGWKVKGKIKETLKTNSEIISAMQSWCDQLSTRGYDAEITAMLF